MPLAEIASLTALRPDFAPNLQEPRHRWFPFKEGFSASLVYEILATCHQPGRVLDPFVGSGTTALVASSIGWTAYGIEVNPFISFLATVKTEPNYDAASVATVANQLLDIPQKTPVVQPLPRDTTLVETRGLQKWLFNRSVARRFEQMRDALLSRPADSTQRLLLLALIAAMLRVANAKRDGKCWRYYSDWQYRRHTAVDLEQAFHDVVSIYIADIQSGRSQPQEPATIHLGDAREMDLLWRTPQPLFDAIITSPPYLNSFDYTDIYRPEMLLLGAARNSRELRDIRFRTVRSHVQVDWPRPERTVLPRVARVVSQLRNADLWNDRIADMVNAYFIDLEIVLKAARRQLRPGAVVCLVLANSAYGGVVVPVDEIVSELLERNNITVETNYLLREGRGNGHHQNRAGRALREVMLVARAA